MDGYFFGKEIAALRNTANDLITLRLLILGAINNIISNCREKKAEILPTVRSLHHLYKQIPESNECETYKFEQIKTSFNNEILEFNIRPFLPQHTVLGKAS